MQSHASGVVSKSVALDLRGDAHGLAHGMSDTRPTASFAEALALLTLDDAGVSARLHKDVLDCAWAGAALLDLAFAGRIDTDLGGLDIVDQAPTGAPALDGVLNAIAARRSRLDARGWIGELSGAQAEAIRAGALAALTARQVLAVKRKRFGARRHELLDASERTALRSRLSAILRADDVPDPWDAALVALLDACDLLASVLPAEEIERAERLAQLRRLDLIGREVAGAIADIERTVVLAVRTQTARLRRRLLLLGAASAIACLGILLLPRIGIGHRFGPTLRERLWFDGAWQEWSGYALLAASGLALAAAGFAHTPLAARAGSVQRWRLAHLCLGAIALALLVAHTGLRLGANLNAALMVCYLTALLLGALTGVATYGASQLRKLGMAPWLPGVLLRWHFLALLPLPALLIAHILVVYAY